MYRLLLSETSTTLCFGKDITESFETNKGSPKGDGISGVYLNIAFEHLRMLSEVYVVKQKQS